MQRILHSNRGSAYRFFLLILTPNYVVGSNIVHMSFSKLIMLDNARHIVNIFMAYTVWKTDILCT